MAVKRKKKKRRTIASTLTPAERRMRREKKQHPLLIRRMFADFGFQRCATDGKHFHVAGRKGELDDVYVHENVIVVVETTASGDLTGHLTRKMPFYNNIMGNVPGFIQVLTDTFPELAKLLSSKFSHSQYRVKVLYAPLGSPDAEIQIACSNVNFMYGRTKKYFSAIASAIQRSARFEFFRFLGLDWKEVGDACLTSGIPTTNYEGHLLPESMSSYPSGYKILSFYADAESLLSKSYVLRRDGWRDEDALYQRIIDRKKITSMRRYLLDEGRVFVNNVIVTLPEGTQLNDLATTGKNVKQDDLHQSKAVSIAIPARFNTVGIVDGQHRIFCYHEGTDVHEEKMKLLRKKQHLLVTGIKYPANTSQSERLKFEAKLFLEINSNQTRTRPALTQDIEVIVRPFSGIAVARKIIGTLATKGAYKDVFHTSFFDSPLKIKTSSIVSYGLRPLVKFDGEDTLFAAFPNKDKTKLAEFSEYPRRQKKQGAEPLELLDEYVEYCGTLLGRFLLAAKLAYGTEGWALDADPRSELLRPTVINGLIASLRLVILNKKPLTEKAFVEGFANIKKVHFNQYRSSRWQELGEEIYEKCFA